VSRNVFGLSGEKSIFTFRMDKVTVTEKREGVWELEVRFERPVVGFKIEISEGMKIIHFPEPEPLTY